MNAGMKMLMLTNARGDGSEHSSGNSARSEMRSGGNMGYSAGMNYRNAEMGGGMENRFHDRRGREHYDNGRFSPVRNEMMARAGRDESGGHSPARSGMEDDSDMSDRYGTMNGYGAYAYSPQNYELEPPRMNKIGFSAEPSAHDREYRQDAEYSRMNEGDRMPGSSPMIGYGRSYGSEKLTKEMAEEWTRGMKNEDGTKGPHWTLDQAKQVMAQRGISSDPIEFWSVLCALYSDYSAVLKKHNANKIDLYADLASAWINDKDAVENKTAAYFDHIVKH